MRGNKVWFLGGLAAGFVIGTRAGRDCYDKMVETALKAKENPTVQEAAGVVSSQATRLGSEAKRLVKRCQCGMSDAGAEPESQDDAAATETDPAEPVSAEPGTHAAPTVVEAADAESADPASRI